MKHPYRFTVLSLVAAAALTAGACAGSAPRYEMTHEHHTIDYIEINVLDVAEAKRFYTDAFGWAFTDYGPDYAGIQRPGSGGKSEVGGLRQVEKVAPGGPLVILYSSDLEASVRAVSDAGGEIVQEPFAFPGGRRFHFHDPSGNELAVWGEATE